MEGSDSCSTAALVIWFWFVFRTCSLFNSFYVGMYPIETQIKTCFLTVHWPATGSTGQRRCREVHSAGGAHTERAGQRARMCTPEPLPTPPWNPVWPNFLHLVWHLGLWHQGTGTVLVSLGTETSLFLRKFLMFYFTIPWNKNIFSQKINQNPGERKKRKIQGTSFGLAREVTHLSISG